MKSEFMEDDGASAQVFTGTMLKDNGKFGFITPDAGGPEMFVLPCEAFGNAMPPVGARLIYEVIVDPKTGRERANNVVPEEGDMLHLEEGHMQDNLLDDPSRQTGTISQNKGKFGFIKLDDGSDMFILPPIPPVGTRVSFGVVIDETTGRPRADNVKQAGQASHSFLSQVDDGNRQSGTVSNDRGKFGFIKLEDGSDMFVLPPVPPVGTRVSFSVVIDETTGRPRADNVRPEAPKPGQVLGRAAVTGGLGGARRSGTVTQDRGKFGFITPDDGGPEMFLLPCEAFGNALPPIGTHVTFAVVADQKTGRDRAENVQPSGPSRQKGTMTADQGKFGFITMDGGGATMFVLPSPAFGGSLPPLGARVSFDVVIDAKTGRERAENVLPESMGTQQMGSKGAGGKPGKGVLGKGVLAIQNGNSKPTAAAPTSTGMFATGTMSKHNGNFGFVTPDDGSPEMFVLPSEAYGNALPPIGARFGYEVVIDAKTGRERADNIQPEEGSLQGVGFAASSGPRKTGTMSKDQGKFGFLTPDDGSPDMFVLPSMAFGNALPPIGARVNYVVVMDAKTGRERADDVAPETQAHRPRPLGAPPAATSGHRAGVVSQDKGKFGFITPDDGGAEMFLLPCEAFGNALPPIGTRVSFDVVIDGKTGRERAEGVQPEFRAAPGRGAIGIQGKGKGPVQTLRPSPTPIGKGKAPIPAWQHKHMQAAAPAASSGSVASGTVSQDRGKFGFITPDDGSADMFMLPAEAYGNALPPIGERVVYEIVTDGKTGRPRAENVQPESGTDYGAIGAPGKASVRSSPY